MCLSIGKAHFLFEGGSLLNALVTGGCKNGKSFFAERLVHQLAEGGRLYYIATMVPSDEEDEERILRHRRERLGLGFQTIEQPRNMGELTQDLPKDSTVLLDSTTALLSNEMFLPDGSTYQGKQPLAEKIVGELLSLSDRVKHIVFVSDWIHSDAYEYDALTQEYRSTLAAIDRGLAKELDLVCEITYGFPMVHKGVLP